MYPEIYNPSKYDHGARWKKRSQENVFTCMHCNADVYTQAMISGVQNRNHCTYCLRSRHVDHAHAGDRMSACKAVMQPIGLTVKPGRNKYGRMAYGELMLVHRCKECGKLSINRLAADDQVERLMETFYASLQMDRFTQAQLNLSGIKILQREDWELVVGQLQGIYQV